jgi:hypothetical protein
VRTWALLGLAVLVFVTVLVLVALAATTWGR